jgi:hypothetical protein
MSLTTLTQHFLNGISLGGANALAHRLHDGYGILRMINFANGDIFMMAGYFMIFSFEHALADLDPDRDRRHDPPGLRHRARGLRAPSAAREDVHHDSGHRRIVPA